MNILDRIHEGHVIGGLVFLLLGAFVGMIVALQPSHTFTTAPDGRPAWLIECGNPGECYTEAAKACPRGYGLLESDETFGGARLIRCKP